MKNQYKTNNKSMNYIQIKILIILIIKKISITPNLQKPSNFRNINLTIIKIDFNHVIKKFMLKKSSI